MFHERNVENSQKIEILLPKPKCITIGQQTPSPGTRVLPSLTFHTSISYSNSLGF